MAAATKKRKKKKKLTLGRLVLVAGTQQTLSNLFWRLLISMIGMLYVVTLFAVVPFTLA
jgi:hypothetical protein